MKKFIFFLFIFPTWFFSQSSYLRKFGGISGPEKRWALFHPFCALKARKLTAKALAIVNEVKEKNLLDKYESGGKLDAFRHSFTMAFLAQKIPVRKLRKLGRAHEKGNYLDFKKFCKRNRNSKEDLSGKNNFEEGELPDSLACEMDLKNNELGFETGKANKEISGDSLKVVMVQKINSGKAYFMRRNAVGKYLTCDGKEILFEEWRCKWSVPKCMVQE